MGRYNFLAHEVNILFYQFVIRIAFLREIINDANGVKVLCRQFIPRQSTYANKQKIATRQTNVRITQNKIAIFTKSGKLHRDR